jgi:hypothetical protein
MPAHERFDGAMLLTCFYKQADQMNSTLGYWMERAADALERA